MILKLKQLLEAIAKGEKEIEVARKNLSVNSEFDVPNIFANIATKDKNVVSKKEIEKYLKDLKISVKPNEVELLVFFYDQDHDKQFTYAESYNLFQCGNADIKKAVPKFLKQDKPSVVIESLVKDLFQKEINLNHEILRILNEFWHIEKFNPHLVFHMLKSENLGCITLDSIKNFLKKVKNEGKTSDALAILKRLDINKDDVIDFCEFHAFLGFPKCDYCCPCSPCDNCGTKYCDTCLGVIPCYLLGCDHISTNSLLPCTSDQHKKGGPVRDETFMKAVTYMHSEKKWSKGGEGGEGDDDGTIYDDRGRRVNEKGELIDDIKVYYEFPQKKSKWFKGLSPRQKLINKGAKILNQNLKNFQSSKNYFNDPKDPNYSKKKSGEGEELNQTWDHLGVHGFIENSQENQYLYNHTGQPIFKNLKKFNKINNNDFPLHNLKEGELCPKHSFVQYNMSGSDLCPRHQSPLKTQSYMSGNDVSERNQSPLKTQSINGEIPKQNPSSSINENEPLQKNISKISNPNLSPEKLCPDHLTQFFNLNQNMESTICERHRRTQLSPSNKQAENNINTPLDYSSNNNPDNNNNQGPLDYQINSNEPGPSLRRLTDTISYCSPAKRAYSPGVYTPFGYNPYEKNNNGDKNFGPNEYENLPSKHFYSLRSFNNKDNDENDNNVDNDNNTENDNNDGNNNNIAIYSPNQFYVHPHYYHSLHEPISSSRNKSTPKLRSNNKSKNPFNINENNVPIKTYRPRYVYNPNTKKYEVQETNNEQNNSNKQIRNTLKDDNDEYIRKVMRKKKQFDNFNDEEDSKNIEYDHYSSYKNDYPNHFNGFYHNNFINNNDYYGYEHFCSK